MIEKTVADFLRERMQIPVVMEVPEKEKRYVIVEKTGGGEDNHIYYATLAIQSVAESTYQASVLNENVKAEMKMLEELDEVSECSLNTDYNFPNVETKIHRYQAIYNITHY